MKSMTGFGRGEAEGEGIRFVVEISTINRKQLDVSLNMPREWVEWESDLRKQIAESVTRGRVQIAIHHERTGQGAGKEIVVHHATAMAWWNAFREAGVATGAPMPDTVAALLQCPGVFENKGSPGTSDEVRATVMKALDRALVALDILRSREGEHLANDILERLQTISRLLEEVGILAPEVARTYRQALGERLAEAGVPLPLDDERLLREIALFADRCDITEEITRARSHVEQFRSFVLSKEPQGRAMDFLSQELHREWNTIGAKATHAGITRLVIAGKTEVEKIREQVQNVE